MAYNIGTFNSSTIGVDEFYVAQMINQGSKTAKPTYQKMYRIDGLVSTTANANGELASDYADNGIHEVAASMGDFTVESEVTGLTPSLFGLIFGRYLPVSGGNAMYSAQNPPALAVAWQTLKANGKRVRHVAYSVKYPEAEFGATTKADSIEFQHITLSGQGAQILWEHIGIDRASNEETKVSGLKYYSMDEEDDAFNKKVFDDWFITVQFIDGEASEAPTLTTLSFAAGTTGKTIATFTHTSADNFVYVIGDPPAKITVGSMVTNGKTAISPQEISVSTGAKITIYALDALSKVIAAKTHVMVDTEIG